MMIRQGNRNGYYLLYLFMTGLFLGILLVNIRHDIWISEDGLLNTAMIRQLQNSEFDGTDEEFTEYIKARMAEYEPYWKPCIILYVDS